MVTVCPWPFYNVSLNIHSRKEHENWLRFEFVNPSPNDCFAVCYPVGPTHRLCLRSHPWPATATCKPGWREAQLDAKSQHPGSCGVQGPCCATAVPFPPGPRVRSGQQLTSVLPRRRWAQMYRAAQGRNRERMGGLHSSLHRRTHTGLSSNPHFSVITSLQQSPTFMFPDSILFLERPFTSVLIFLKSPSLIHSFLSYSFDTFPLFPIPSDFQEHTGSKETKENIAFSLVTVLTASLNSPPSLLAD